MATVSYRHLPNIAQTALAFVYGELLNPRTNQPNAPPPPALRPTRPATLTPVCVLTILHKRVLQIKLEVNQALGPVKSRKRAVLGYVWLDRDEIEALCGTGERGRYLLDPLTSQGALLQNGTTR